MDVKSLYTVIPHQDGLEALRFFFNQRTNQEPSTTTLVRLAELVLTLNNFSFDGEHYQQISGVAMGTKMGPNCANLFVGYVEKQTFEGYTDPITDFYGRFIDDCLGTTSCLRTELDCFINFVNNFRPTNISNNKKVPLVLTFHPFNFKVRDITFRNFEILKNDPETSSIFSDNTLVSFRHSKNIRETLLHSSLRQDQVSPTGTSCCLRPVCKTCKHLHPTTSISVPKCKFEIKHSFTCVSSLLNIGVIYKQ